MELLLGYKELFSLLFIVFVLLGVFFAMGYVMGRNSGPLNTARPAEASESNSSARTGRQSAAQSPVVIDERPSAPEQAAPSGQSAAPASPADAGPLTVVEPKPGQAFLQVSAVAKPEAELLVEILTKKGFRAIVAPGPSEKLFRVLVGPADNDADLARTRTELEQSGFRPIPRRY